ncbi:MAG: hypothetical protein ACRDHL_11585 [Candidatus Promineifilaceae bacterium]
MTTYPGSPKLTKGAIVGVDLVNPLASVVIFQYNPKTMSRSLEAQTAQEGGARSESLRLAGPPREKITINELHLDAADQLEKGGGALGLYPQLSALEMLLYPKSAAVILNTALMAAGTIEIVQPAAPLTLFIWGVKRVLPVRLTSFTINEEEYDPDLHPIRASLSLTLSVLSYSDFSITHPGYYLFLTHQVVKETLAVLGSVGDLGAVAGGEIELF